MINFLCKLSKSKKGKNKKGGFYANHNQGAISHLPGGQRKNGFSPGTEVESMAQSYEGPRWLNPNIWCR